MKRATVSQVIPKCVSKIGSTEQLFLDETKDVREQPQRLQKILEAVWDIISIFYPIDRIGDTLLEIPSNRLAELGFVSLETKARIERRKLRKQMGNKYIADAGRNILLITNTGAEFILTETYVTEEEFFGSGIRRDCVVRDKIRLTRDKEFAVVIEREMENYHVHVLNEIWYPQDQGLTKQSFFVEVTARRVNIILVLLLEGIVPGFLNSHRRN